MNLILFNTTFLQDGIKTNMQWNDDSTGSQCKGTFSTSYSILPLFSSLDLIGCVEGSLWKTRAVIHPQPSCVSINCPGLSLLHHSLSITNLLGVDEWLHTPAAFLSCCFSKGDVPLHLPCCFSPRDIKAIYVPLWYPQALTVFGEIQKSLESVMSNINNHGKNRREFLNTKTLPGNIKTRN